MSFRRNLGVKKISDKNFLFDLTTLSTIKKLEPINNTKKTETIDNPIKTVNSKEYTVSNESVLLVKTEESSTIFINENSNDYIVIKSLTNTTIKPVNSTIDEEYEELNIGKGACVELLKIDGNWYVISSDGIKMS
jgi:hypothetical protein